MLLRTISLSHISTYLYVLRTSVRKKSHLTNSKTDRWNRKKTLTFMINYIGTKYVT